MPKRTGLLATLDYPYPLKVEIDRPEFEMYSSLAYLDLSKLSRGSHRVEVGNVKGGCCGQKAIAIVKAGKVTGIKFEACRESKKKPLSKEDRAVVDAAFKKIGKLKPNWKPVAVEEFFGDSSAAEQLIITIGESCVRVCWGDATPQSPRKCITCCSTEGRLSCQYSESSTVVIF
jgi:hypothetical protein